MGDHFDISGVFETTEFEIAKSACMCQCITRTITVLRHAKILSLLLSSFVLTTDRF